MNVKKKQKNLINTQKIEFAITALLLALIFIGIFVYFKTVRKHSVKIENPQIQTINEGQ